MSTHPHDDDTRRERLRDRARSIESRILRTLDPRTHKARSDAPSRVLSAPLVTLFVSPSDPRQSVEAFDILAGSRTAFRVEASADGTVSARFAGRDQHGVDGVRNLADALLHARGILLEPNEDLQAELERRRVPGLRERAECELGEHLATARGDFERILESAGATAPHRGS